MTKEKAYIFLNGQMDLTSKMYRELSKDGHIYCADGGTEHCLKLGLVPREVWGDFDSLSSEKVKELEESGVKLKKFSSEKDFTDGELLLEYVHSKGYNYIYILGGLGGRLDHELTNINLISKYKNVYILSEKELVFFVQKKYTFINNVGKTISFIPFSNSVEDLNLRGFKYPLNNYKLLRGDSRCLSNIILEERAEVELKSGMLLCVINY